MVVCKICHWSGTREQLKIEEKKENDIKIITFNCPECGSHIESKTLT